MAEQEEKGEKGEGNQNLEVESWRMRKSLAELRLETRHSVEVAAPENPRRLLAASFESRLYHKFNKFNESPSVETLQIPTGRVALNPPPK